MRSPVVLVMCSLTYVSVCLSVCQSVSLSVCLSIACHLSRFDVFRNWRAYYRVAATICVGFVDAKEGETDDVGPLHDVTYEDVQRQGIAGASHSRRPARGWQWLE